MCEVAFLCVTDIRCFTKDMFGEFKKYMGITVKKLPISKAKSDIYLDKSRSYYERLYLPLSVKQITRHAMLLELGICYVEATRSQLQIIDRTNTTRS